MGESSLYTKVLLTVIAVAVCLGVYFVVDAFDLLRRQEAQTQTALQEMTKELRRLGRRPAEGMTAVRAPAAGEEAPANLAPPSGSAPDAGQRWAFQNSDLRDPDAQDGGVRVTAVSSFSGTLNVLLPGSDANVSRLWDLVNDSLGGRNLAEPARFEPRLARRWEISPDGKVFTIHLRPGVYWHDFTDPITGKTWADVPVTSQDFAFFAETLRNPEIPCDSLRNYYKDLDRIEVLDDQTFKVIWKETYFRAKEFTLGLQPYPRHLYRPDPVTTDSEYARDLMEQKTERNQMIVGCGPYIFEEYRTGQFVRLRRNPNYYGPAPHLNTLEIRQIKDSEIELVELKKGGIDAMGLTATQWVKQTGKPEFLTVVDDVESGLAQSRAHARRKKQTYLRDGSFGEHSFEKYLYRSFAYNFIAWNTRRPLFADRTVRVALTHCIDRRRIIREVFHDLGTLITGNFVPHSLYYDHEIEPWPFDLETARRLLGEAGWEDTDGDGIIDRDLDGDGTREPFRFVFLTIPNHPYQSRWVPMIKQDLQKAGIHMETKPAEWAVFQKQIEEFDFDATSFYWSGGIESDPYQLWHGSQASIKKSSNIAGFDHPEANRLIETARRTLDLEKRTELYHRFHRIVHEEQPYTFLMCPHSKLAQHKRYQNTVVYPLGVSSSLMWVPAPVQQELSR